MSGRLDDLDALGPAPACRRLPAVVWLGALAALLLGAAVAVVVQVVA